MNNKTIIGIVLALVILVGLFLWLKPFNSGEPNSAAIGIEEEEMTQDLAVDHFFQNGVHTIEGTLDLPTPCHEIKSSVVVGSGDPVAVIITMTPEATGEICRQVIPNKLFSQQG